MTFGIAASEGQEASFQALGLLFWSRGDARPTSPCARNSANSRRGPTALAKDFCGIQKGSCHQEASWGGGFMGRNRKVELERNPVCVKVLFLELRGTDQGEGRSEVEGKVRGGRGVQREVGGAF